MSVKLRKATSSDFDAVYRLVCDLENTLFDRLSFQDIYLRNLEHPAIGYFVATLDDSVVGFASVYVNELLHHCGKIAEIQELVVANQHRRHGIGSQLIIALQHWSKQQGAEQIEVTSQVKRTQAGEFYLGCGFLDTHKKFIYPL